MNVKKTAKRYTFVGACYTDIFVCQFFFILQFNVQIFDEQILPNLNVEVFTDTYISCFVETSNDPDLFEKPIVDGNISLVPYDTVKEDALWNNIEKSTETFLRKNNSGDEQKPIELEGNSTQNPTAAAAEAADSRKAEGDCKVEDVKEVKTTKTGNKKRQNKIRENSCVIT